ncbi:MAG: major capsid protein [Sterolibacterium sp.]|nr:major capsid protein [Sterolibacterium sp.]
MKTYCKQHAWQLLAVALIIMACLAGVMPPDASLMAAPLLIGNTYAPFPVTPQYTAISLAYRNNKLIADEVLPRVPVPLQAFKYLSYPKGTFFTVPETLVGRKGTPNQVEFTGTEVDSSTQDHALDDKVPIADIENARNQPGMPDPLGRAVEGTTELIALGREKRVADLVFDAAQYAAANKIALTGNDQWNVDHADSNPIADITTGLDTCIMRPNVMVIGRAAFTKLATHKLLVKAYNGTAGDAGLVPRAFIAQLFELDEVLVGEGWINTAKKGQAPTMVRVWGKHCALVYRNRLADTQRGTTFGFTAQWGARIAGSEYSRDIGMRGGQVVRVGESVKELLIANDLGYFIENAVA